MRLAPKSQSIIGFLITITLCLVGFSEALGVTHSQLQAVDSNGNPTFSKDQFPISIQGVVLNDPALMLDGTANFIPFNGTNYWELGGQWQIFFQTVSSSDFGGSCAWMGQNYGTTPEWEDDAGSYSNEEWESELARLNQLIDPVTQETVTLAPGMLIQINAAIGRPYAGKFNINEDHSNVPENDFDIVLLDANYGLPDPTELTLADIMDTSGDFYFDETRATGAEHYQSTLVTVSDLMVVDDTNWGPGGSLIVGDGVREFHVELGVNEAFASMSVPEGTFSITGVFDQEVFAFEKKSGYLLWATTPEAFLMAIPGDCNGDNMVTTADLAAVTGNWQQYVTGGATDGDLNGDGQVTTADLAAVTGNWQYGVTAVPEPSSIIAILALFVSLALSSGRFSKKNS
jgi:Dockerin type I domain